MSESRLAVIDCGSNSFRLVVFTSTDTWWKRTDEIHESVRVGEGLDATGELGPAPMERALETLGLYAHFCQATGIDRIRPVATSAIRDASNQKAFLEAARRRSGLEIEVLAGEQEASYGYLAAINTTTLSQGVVLDLGGGSMQLTRVEDREAIDGRSWPFGAVRMTERFMPEGGKAKRKQMKALRDHVAAGIEHASWLDEGGRLCGIGGTVRNLAAATQLAAGLPSYGIQGFRITRDALGELIATFADLPPEERASVPGIKFGRADLILAGALVIDTVMEVGGFAMLEATEAGLREGVFFESLLGDPPLVEHVRHATVCTLAAQYDTDFAHVRHVATLSLELWDALAAAGLHRGDPKERELLWATAMLHDIGTAVDYDDHHKHSRYLILSAGLPGFSPRETALVGQAARYHRKGNPGLGEFASLARGGAEPGEVRFDGRDLLKLRPDEMRKLRGDRLSMIFQQPQSSLNPVWDVGRQIGEVLELHRGMKRGPARSRALELLRMVGISDPERRLKAFPHEMSGGMAQRVMIAMALACEPELLIADEPTTALDVTIQAQILDLMRNLRDETGTAIILITHDLGVVAEMCDRVAVMYAGEIVEETDIVSLFRDPKHPYTRGLIGSIPVVGAATDELAVIPGSVPNLINLPEGCRFAPRCLARVEADLTISEERHPELRAVGSGHDVRCWLYHDASGELIPEELRAPIARTG